MNADSAVRLEARISGRVQGVFYRAGTERTARALRLTGWVRNRSDGAVELVAEGPRPACDSLLEYCRVGPPAARVEHIETSWGEAAGTFEAFETRF